MASLQEFLGEAQQMSKPKIYMDNNGEYHKYSAMPKGKGKKKKMAKMSGSYLLADFGVPMWQRAMIEAKEGLKTIKGVAKDVVSKKVYNDPRTKSMWEGDLGKGFAEARNRVKSSLRKANDVNIEKELTKNKSLDLQVDKMRQAGKKKYAAEGAKNLTRSEGDGVLSVDKRYKRG
jgi:hypothetical protein